MDFNLKSLKELCLIFLGTCFIIFMAIKKIPIPFTTVHMSLQSLSISMLVIFLGRRAVFSVLLYLGLASVGLPILAEGVGNATWFFSASAGYYVGFLIAAFCLAYLLIAVKPRTFWKTWFCFSLNESIILLCGFLMLSHQFGSSQAWWIGVWPYLVGALLKITIAASVYFIKCHMFYGKRFNQA